MSKLPCCTRCEDKNIDPGTGLQLSHIYFIVCQVCGNKRCPKATDHRLECSGSNRPGQIGSLYQ